MEAYLGKTTDLVHTITMSGTKVLLSVRSMVLLKRFYKKYFVSHTIITDEAHHHQQIITRETG